MSKRVGRNDPCPCGSGKKYKKCHGFQNSPLKKLPNEILPEMIQKKLEQQQAAELQRQEQQGLGKPIISTIANGVRSVVVGDKIFSSQKWKSFHDFLHDYVKSLIDNKWANEELGKPQSERHPFLIWYEMAIRYQNQFIKEPGEVHAAPITGAGAAYLGLAYNLYLTAHNVNVQEVLLKRLKNKDSFYGAYYETCVVASLIKAGFEIEFEDESDVTTTHCELTATHQKTGRKFSVEAKMRGANKTSANVRNQLYSALKKAAKHTRVVFIEVNMPDECDKEKALHNLKEALNSIRSCEITLTIDNQLAPPAYVVLTNNPYQYSLNSSYQFTALAEGFKIPDFKLDYQFLNIREALDNREKHVEMYGLLQSLKNSQIPATFDGDNPDLAFGNIDGRLIIGKKYLIPDGQGNEVIGELQHASVMENKKSVFGIYKLSDGKQIMAECPMTDDELAAYRRHPDTFFGVVKKGARGGINDPLEFYDYCLEIYKDTPKEKMLALMGMRGQEQYEKLPQKQLTEKYVEGLVCQVMTMAAKQPKKTND